MQQYNYLAWSNPNRSPQSLIKVGQGLLNPYLVYANPRGQFRERLFVFPPRYRRHEAYLAGTCGVSGVVDVSLGRGLKAAFRWTREEIRAGWQRWRTRRQPATQ